MVSGKKSIDLDQIETSAPLGRPMPMHSRKKLQKKETSAPIPKKYLEYEVSQQEVVRGNTDWNCPPSSGPLVTIPHELFYDRRSW